MEGVKRTSKGWNSLKRGHWWFYTVVTIMFVLVPVFDQAGAKDDPADCVRFQSTIQYSDVVGDGGEARIDGGNGLVFVFSAANQKGGTPGPSIGRRTLVVLDKGQKVRQLEESFYTSFSSVERSTTTFWAVEEYTGGAHCCNRYHFFAKSGPDEPIRYLGSTDGTVEPAENPWVCKGKDLYFEDSDIRFINFHIDYAHSRLYIPRFYHLTASSVAVSNRPFKDVYRDEIAEVNTEIEEKSRSRASKPSAILRGDGPMVFADDLGPLLVQRTILYLFAREDKKAWGTLLKDVRSRYKTTQGVGTLRREIEKLLEETPY